MAETNKPFVAVQMYVPPFFLVALLSISSLPAGKLVDPSPLLDHWIEGLGYPLALQ